jgi:hypothetical protein
MERLCSAIITSEDYAAVRRSPCFKRPSKVVWTDGNDSGLVRAQTIGSNLAPLSQHVGN